MAKEDSDERTVPQPSPMFLPSARVLVHHLALSLGNNARTTTTKMVTQGRDDHHNHRGGKMYRKCSKIMHMTKCITGQSKII